MTAKEYLDSLIAGQEMGSELPIYLSELLLLRALLDNESKTTN